MNNQIIKTTDLKTLMQSDYVQDRFRDVLGKKAPGFITSVLSIAANNDLLVKADPKTILNAAMTAATLDLPINQNLGFAYIIPYSDRRNNQVVAQFQLGYKGFVQLSMRSGQFKTINATDIREGEIAELDRLTGEMKFDWKDDREKLPVIGYVAYMKLINGFEKTLYMTVNELKSHGNKYSQTARKGYGLWSDDFDAMAKKTVIKQLLSKYAPLTTEMQKAQLADQAIINDEGEYSYIDNQHLLPEEVAEEKEHDRIKNFIEKAVAIEELHKCNDAVYDSQDESLIEIYEEKGKELGGSK